MDFSKARDRPNMNFNQGGAPYAQPPQGAAPQGAQAGHPAQMDPVVRTTTQTFMQDVIDASMHIGVVAYFWSKHSPQSQKTATILERMVMQSGGKARLALINAEENAQLVQQMQVQAYPTIFAIKDGRPVDMLAGPQNDTVLKSLVDKITGNAQMQAQIGAMLEAAKKALGENQIGQAAQMYQQIMQVDQGNPSAIAGFLRCHMALGNLDQARSMLEQLPEDLKANPEIVSVITSLALLGESTDGDINEVLAKLEADPNDHQARFDLAMMAFAGGDAALAVRELLDIVSRDREWHDDGARKRLIEIFEALGPSDAVAKAGRRRLQMMLLA